MNMTLAKHDAAPSKIADAIKNSVYSVTEVKVEESEERVVLSGSVPSFYIKQAAQEAVRGHLGRRRLHNRLVVCRN